MHLSMHLYQLPIPLLVLSASVVLAAGPHWSLAEDFYAFPKYRVSFLNGLPVLNETAERWLHVGLKGGEPEFLDQPGQNQAFHLASTLNRIESGDVESAEPSQGTSDSPRSSPYRIERMQIAGKNPYVCLIPPPIESHTKPVEEPQIEASATQSLSLLNTLSNSCIYHRQGWFTYAYCHNSHVRQFREMAHSHPHHAGYVPEEDPEWEAYTLGQSPTAQTESRELTGVQQETLANSVDIVKNAGHRYLVQKMGDGTVCDKTGRPREIEVQFHCSQIVTDAILFVKETSTCRYIMVIHTPRLCGEPGFKTRLEQREEALIRCREVLDSAEAVDAADKTLPASAHPIDLTPRPSILDIPPPRPIVPVVKEEKRHAAGLDKKTSDMLTAAIEAFIANNNNNNNNNKGKAGHGHTQQGSETVLVASEDGDLVIDIEYIDADDDDDDDSDDAVEKLEGLVGKASGKLGRLEEALRAAGYDVSTISPADATDASEKEEKSDGKAPADQKMDLKHEEL